jgi:hypothetical protein
VLPVGDIPGHLSNPENNKVRRFQEGEANQEAPHLVVDVIPGQLSLPHLTKKASSRVFPGKHPSGRAHPSKTNDALPDTRPLSATVGLEDDQLRAFFEGFFDEKGVTTHSYVLPFRV